MEGCHSLEYHFGAEDFDVCQVRRRCSPWLGRYTINLGRPDSKKPLPLAPQATTAVSRQVSGNRDLRLKAMHLATGSGEVWGMRHAFLGTRDYMRLPKFGLTSSSGRSRTAPRCARTVSHAWKRTSSSPASRSASRRSRPCSYLVSLDLGKPAAQVKPTNY